MEEAERDTELWEKHADDVFIAVFFEVRGLRGHMGEVLVGTLVEPIVQSVLGCVDCSNYVVSRPMFASNFGFAGFCTSSTLPNRSKPYKAI